MMIPATVLTQSQVAVQRSLDLRHTPPHPRSMVVKSFDSRKLTCVRSILVNMMSQATVIYHPSGDHICLNNRCLAMWGAAIVAGQATLNDPPNSVEFDGL
ncbi:hypothetical protein FRC03_011904 [Tulasnella sp. 419]|nr:hypothetical protein FRC02_000877 [Tulasnella sp. 418]KAG8953178.1 hypothetical protein FRC03_011904 [Tulasnella sp. 419]